MPTANSANHVWDVSGEGYLVGLEKEPVGGLITLFEKSCKLPRCQVYSIFYMVIYCIL